MHPSLAQTDHRPWPLPASRWTWRQRWHNLLFAHWPIAVDKVRAFVPELLEIDQFEGTTWIGVIPFRMTGVMRRPMPDIAWISAFPEINVRVYVSHGGKPGVWFLSLDATNPLAVWAARRFFHLPYHLAEITMTATDEEFAYDSRRRSSVVPANFRARYSPCSSDFVAAHGSIEHFLVERDRLYAQRQNGRITRTNVHHAPCGLQHANAEVEVNGLLRSHVDVSGPPSLLHFVRIADVVVWPDEPLD